MVIDFLVRLRITQWADAQKEVVGRVGFEPTTNWLKANCSTN